MNGRTPEVARTQAFILAGGQGERLHPLTVSRPKPAVSFGGVFRIIDFTLSNCLYSGVSQVCLVTQYRYEELHRYIREGWSEVWRRVTRPSPSSLMFLPPTTGKRYRGTADAIFHNSELLESEGAEFVLILGGDHIYQMDYRALLRQHAETDADLTIATVEYPVREASQFGVVEVETNFRVTGFEEKPARPRPLPSKPSLALVNMGVYVFKRKALLDALQHFCGTGQGYDFGRDIIPSLIHSSRTYAYDFRDAAKDSPCYWRDIGTLDAYYQASMDLLDPDGPFDPYASEGWRSQPTRHPRLTGSAIATATPSIHAECHVTRSVMSPDVHVEANVNIADSVIMPGVRIGKGARLRRTIVEEGVHIPAGFQAGHDVDQDRQHHTVTDGGVVVVSKTLWNAKPSMSLAGRAVQARPAAVRQADDAVRAR